MFDRDANQTTTFMAIYVLLFTAGMPQLSPHYRHRKEVHYYKGHQMIIAAPLPCLACSALLIKNT